MVNLFFQYFEFSQAQSVCQRACVLVHEWTVRVEHHGETSDGSGLMLGLVPRTFTRYGEGDAGSRWLHPFGRHEE